MKSLKQPCIKKRRIIHNSISRDRGKTGALIELSVPLEVAAGITNYEIVREHFLKDLAQDPQQQPSSPTSEFARRGAAPPPAGGVWSTQGSTSSDGLVSLTIRNFRSVDASYFFQTNARERTSPNLRPVPPLLRPKQAPEQASPGGQQTTATSGKQALVSL